MYRIMPKSKSTLKRTIVGEWIIDERDRKDVDDEMRLFQCAFRTAFNRLLDGISIGDVEKHVYGMFNLNYRYTKDAVMQAMSVIRSQKELVKRHLMEKERSLKGLRKRLKNIKDEEKRKNLEVKIERFQSQVDVLKEHQANKTIPKVIFGGRKNFDKRRSGQLSNEAWKNLRNNKLYSRGDKSKAGGNLNTRIEITKEGFDTTSSTQPKGFSLSVAISHLSEKNKTAPRVEGKLWVDTRLRRRLREHLEDGGIYSISLIRGLDNKYRVHITFDEFVPIQTVSFLTGAIGVDVNPDGIALTEVSREGNYIESRFLPLPELTYSRRTKRDNLIGECAKEIVLIALSGGKGLVIESLDFVRQNKGKRFNRMSHNFVYRRLLSAIERKCKKCGVAFKTVSPAYMSIIGKYKYAASYGLNLHQAAAFVIARHGLGFRERIPKRIQLLIEGLIGKLNSLLEAAEAKEKKEVKRLLTKLQNWSNIHSWSFWYTFNKALRKVGVKPWLLRDINLLYNEQIFVH